jgi:male germ cell-associated kinase
LHRDLKPENLLYANGKLKIADFGLCKEHKPSHNNHSSYVSTRWYRAPEVIFKLQNYDCKVDLFAIGCIMAEMYRGDPLMPGTSESDMIYRLANLIG